MKRLQDTLRVILFTALALAPASAWAQYAEDEERDVLPDMLDRNEFMVTAHIRGVFVPKFVLDPWFDEHASTWQDGQRNLAYGGQFTWRVRGDYELGVTVDWANLSTPSQFWLEKDKEPADAEYTTVDLSLLSLTFSSYWYWDVQPWLSPYVGAGLGVGVLFGELLQYEPVMGSACEQGLGQGSSFAPPECFDEDGAPAEGQIEAEGAAPERMPPVLPTLHVALGVRFNIFKWGVLRLEAGLNDYAYVGASIGGQWW